MKTEASLDELGSLRQRYRELNDSFARVRICQSATGGGFCAEAIWLLKCMVSCLVEETKLVVATHPRGSGFSLGSGWGDYFVPPFPTTRKRRYALLNRATYPGHSFLPEPSVRLLRSATRRLLGADLLQFDPLTLPHRITVPALGWELDWWQGCRLCLELLWCMRADVAEEVAVLEQGFGVSSPYAAVHMRRGDKDTGAAFVEIERYAHAITASPAAPRLVVVASDDASAPPSLATLLGPGYDVIALSAPENRGYFQRSFDDLPADARRAQTVRFLAEFETLRRSSVAFVTLTSNVGSLLRYARGNRAIYDVTSATASGRSST